MNAMRAEMKKWRHTPLLTAHAVIAVGVSVIFLLYYSYAPWSLSDKISGYYQMLGVGFPMLIGIFAARAGEQEQQAGHYQNVLMQPHRLRVFLAQLLTLQLLGLAAVLAASVLFGVGLQSVLGQWDAPYILYVRAALLLWCSVLPLYVWHMFLALRCGRGVSVGAGIAEGLLSALLLTGIGTYLWYYVPCAWAARGVSAWLVQQMDASGAKLCDWSRVRSIYGIVLIGAVCVYLLWVQRWEGSTFTE